MNVGRSVRPGDVATVRSAAACREAGGFVRAPLPDEGDGFLLYAVSGRHAVGASAAGPVVQRWNGIAWEADVLPATPAEFAGAALTSVAGDVAVGGCFDHYTNGEAPLLLRRTGSGWTDDKAPDVGFPYVLTGVSGDWAVGHGFPGTVVLHYEGGSWTPVRVPGRPAKLLAVAALGSRVWAVGARDRDGIVLRFDGRTWHEDRTKTGPVTCVTAFGDEVWAASGRTLLRPARRRWERLDAPIRVNALTGLTPTGPALLVAGQGETAEFDGRNWSVRELPGTWLGADPHWLVGSA